MLPLVLRRESLETKKSAQAPILSARGMRDPHGASKDVVGFLEAELLDKSGSMSEFCSDTDLIKGGRLTIPRTFCTPVFLESHGRPKEWDVANEDSGKRKSSSKAPYALVQHFAPGRSCSQSTFHSPRRSNFIRMLGVFESVAVAHALVDALACPVRNNFPPQFQMHTWQKFCGWDSLNLSKPFHFILLCHDQPVEVYASDASELPNHGPYMGLGGLGDPYPSGCKVSQQEFSVVRFRPWWTRMTNVCDEYHKQPTPSFSDMFAEDSDRIITELKAVQEVHACVVTRSLAKEHALEIIERLFVKDSYDESDKIHTPNYLVAVIRLYEWLELPPDGGNDVPWQDMRLRRAAEVRREDKERYQPPQRRPEKDETIAQVDKRQLHETLQKIRQGKFEIKRDEILSHRNSSPQRRDEKASVIEARLNRLRSHVTKTNVDLQDLTKMAIISGSAGR